MPLFIIIDQIKHLNKKSIETVLLKTFYSQEHKVSHWWLYNSLQLLIIVQKVSI